MYMKKLIIILAVLFSLSGFAQERKYTLIADRYEWLAGLFRALGLPAGDEAAFEPGQRMRAGSIYYDSSGVNAGLKIWDGLAWVDVGGGSTETASEGLTKVGDDIQFGGVIGTPSIFTENRVVDLGERQLHFAKDYVPVVEDTTNSHFKLTVIDTIYANALPLSIVKTAATGLSRIYRVTGNFASQFKVGHAFTTKYEFGSNASVLSNGGDFGGNTYSSLNMGYLPSFTAGTLRITGGPVPFESVFATLSNVAFSSSNASRRMRYTGYLSGHNVNLRMTNFPDTLDNFIFYNSSNFVEAAAKVFNTYVYYVVGTAAINKAWSVFSPINTNKMFHQGNVIFGGNDTVTVSPYKFKVNGDSYFSDSMYLNTARQISDTTGMDIILRKRSDGALVRIRADLLGGAAPTFQQVLTAGNTLTGTQGVLTNSSFYIQSTDVNPVFNPSLNNANTNTVDDVITVSHNTTGTAADGIGSAIKYYSELSNGSSNETVRAYAKWINATSGTRNAEYGIQGVTNAGALTDWLRLDGSYAYLHASDTAATRAYARSVGGGGGTPSLTQYRLAVGDASNLLSTGAAITANRALISDANGVPTHSTVTNTELGHISGVTSAIQTQLDAKQSITTTNPAHTGITPTGTGIMPLWYPARVASDYTMTNSNTVQPAFPSTIDVWTLQGNTSYYFKGVYTITSGATSHSVGMSFALGGGASLTRIGYTTFGKQSNTPTGTPTMQTIATNSNTAVTTAAAAGVHTITFEGWITMNAGGTVTPSITFSADPTGTILMKADSWISFIPMGDGSFVSSGPVN